MLNRFLTLLEGTIVIGSFVAMMCFGFANVVARYFLHVSLAFSIELVINLGVLMTMVAAAIGVKHGSHLGFELIKEKAPKPLQRAIVTLITVGTVLLFTVLLHYGLQSTLAELRAGQTTPAMGVPKWIFSAAIPFGSLLCIVRSCQVFWLEMKPTSRILPDSEIRERGQFA
ncbi:TRAP transporter small permease [Leucobacter chinensis]|uniref:TRAP transporter small permease n=1 Tax=Leucobacter chinensis TaxID=2851010 RepID=UPI001C24EEEF|nr:TRAP transporter small permease [Leucobacter chinensis]